MKIIKTSKYVKIAGINQQSIDTAILGISMAAKRAFDQQFPALDKVGDMSHRNEKIDYEMILNANSEIEYITDLQKSHIGTFGDGYYESLEKIPAWLNQIQDQQELDDQFFQKPYMKDENV